MQTPICVSRILGARANRRSMMWKPTTRGQLIVQETHEQIWKRRLQAEKKSASMSVARALRHAI